VAGNRPTDRSGKWSSSSIHWVGFSAANEKKKGKRKKEKGNFRRLYPIALFLHYYATIFSPEKGVAKEGGNIHTELGILTVVIFTFVFSQILTRGFFEFFGDITDDDDDDGDDDDDDYGVEKVLCVPFVPWLLFA
jgi:hypothetical protein